MNHTPKTDRRALVSKRHKDQRAAMARAARPRLASTILLVRGEPGAEQVLMGLRSSKHDFMPDIYVFPGGRVDRADSYAKSADTVNTRTQNILQAAMPAARARACVMASIRETFEETGFVIGEPSHVPSPKTRHKIWEEFYATQHLADLSSIHVIGRAVTPPYRPKRFDTWFFMSRLTPEQAARPFGDSDELLDTQWVDIAHTDGLKMHPVTQMMLTVLQGFLNAPAPKHSVPYSRLEHGKFVRDSFPKQP